MLLKETILLKLLKQKDFWQLSKPHLPKLKHLIKKLMHVLLMQQTVKEKHLQEKRKQENKRLHSKKPKKNYKLHLMRHTTKSQLITEKLQTVKEETKRATLYNKPNKQKQPVLAPLLIAKKLMPPEVQLNKLERMANKRSLKLKPMWRKLRTD